MKKVKTFVALVLILSMVVPFTACKKEPAAITVPGFVESDYDKTGDCGEKAKWGFVEETGELTIMGEGDMTDYERDMSDDAENIAPWAELDVKSVKIQGVKTVGAYAFADCANLTTVTIGEGVTQIREGAFNSCKKLNSIELPNTLTAIDGWVFCFCTGLTELKLPGSIETIGDGAFNGAVNLADVYFDGTEGQWSNVTVSEEANNSFAEAIVHFA